MEIEIVNYVKEARLHGLSDSEIKKNLLDAGWEADKVEESFAHLRVQETKNETASLNKPLERVENTKPSAQTGYLASASPAVTQQTTTSINDPSLTEASVQSRPRSKNMVRAVVGIIVVLLLAAGGYFAYAYGYTNPSNVWKKFTQTKSSTIYENNYRISYNDPGSFEEDGFLGMTLKDIKLSLEGNAYVNASDPSNPISKSDLQYTFSSGNTSFSTGFKYILLNKVLYLNVGENPLLRSFMSMAGEGKTYEWIKLDFGAITRELEGENMGDYQEIQQILSPDFKEELQKIWESTTIIRQERYLGRETVNGVSTLHYKNTIDKEAVKQLVRDYAQKFVDKTESWSEPLKQEEADMALEVVNQLIDKVEIKELETWIGARDFRLYKVHLVSNAPSFISLAKNADSLNMSSSGDAKRLSDMRQMASALELYFNDNSGYPDAKDGKPLDLTPNYIGTLPTAPEASGNCTDYYNSYWYQPKGAKSILPSGKTVYSDYEFTSCFGSAVGGYAAGIVRLSPLGLDSPVPCSGNPEQCFDQTPTVNQNEEMKKKVSDFISKLDFSAEIRVDADYKNYGQSVDVQAPAEYYDVLTALGSAREKSRDAKRLSDIRQLASALELYFNDKSQYPVKLTDLTPTYIGIVPTPPTPNDGTCTAEQNNYTYNYVSSEQYELNFCMGEDVAGYGAGPHTLTPAGIK